MASKKVKLALMVLLIVFTLILCVTPEYLSGQNNSIPAGKSHILSDKKTPTKKPAEITNRLQVRNNGDERALRDEHVVCPADQKSICGHAATLIASGSLDEAEAMVRRALKEHDSAGFYSLLGKIELARNAYKSAAVDFQIAAQMDPSEQNVFDFGIVLARLDYDASAKILRYGTEKYPSSERMLVALGVVSYALSSPLEGADYLCRAQELNPSDPHPMEIIADTETIPRSLLSRVTKLMLDLAHYYPENGTALFDYAMVTSGRWSGESGTVDNSTAQQIKSALALNPKQPAANFQLGVFESEQGDYASAIKYFQRAIALRPERGKYHYHLAFAYHKLGNETSFHEEMREFQRLRNQVN